MMEFTVARGRPSVAVLISVIVTFEFPELVTDVVAVKSCGLYHFTDDVAPAAFRTLGTWRQSQIWPLDAPSGPLMAFSPRTCSLQQKPC